MKIVFCFTGQSRTSPFSLNKKKRNNEILDSYNKYIFTEEFKKKYDYEIYISTDNIDLDDTINYFNRKNIGNIHLFDTDFYLKPVKNKPCKLILCLKKHDLFHDPKYEKHEGSIYQHYKYLDCFSLYTNNIIYNHAIKIFDCKYIVRMRLDSKFEGNILKDIEYLNNNKDTGIFLAYDFYAIGRPAIMECYLTGLLHKYGTYSEKCLVPNHRYSIGGVNMIGWRYAPERQLFEMLFDFCIKNKKCPHKYIKDSHIATIILR